MTTPETATRRGLLLANTTAALTACSLMIFVHELAHLIVGLWLGHPGLMRAFSVVQLDEQSDVEAAVIALAGPVLSLVMGAIMQLWMPLRKRADQWHLLWLWFAFVSVEEGVAYLCLTPFGAGDVGIVADRLDLPVFVSWIALLVGVGGMILNARLFAPHLARHAGPEHAMRMQMSLFPWLYGMAALFVLTMGYLMLTPDEIAAVDQIAVILSTTVLLVFAPMANMFHRQVASVPHEPLTVSGIPRGVLVVLILIVVVNLLLSVVGLRVG